LVVNFAFEVMGVRRLDARGCVENGRGTGALRTVCAVREAILHQSFERRGERLDQGLWTILREDRTSPFTSY
jgi:RimJ/RimL family protein N-acetyltransferase